LTFPFTLEQLEEDEAEKEADGNVIK
jgi:hypothetical protein